MARKVLRVQFTDDEYGLEIATSIQLVMPEMMGISEGADYLRWKIARDIDTYAADECARHFYD